MTRLQRQALWLNGYLVTLAQVIESDGDGGIAPPLATAQGASWPTPGQPTTEH